MSVRKPTIEVPAFVLRTLEEGQSLTGVVRPGYELLQDHVDEERGGEWTEGETVGFAASLDQAIAWSSPERGRHYRVVKLLALTDGTALVLAEHVRLAKVVQRFEVEL